MTIIAAQTGGFLPGLLIGVALGFLVRPALRSWIAAREWTEASREARLTDEALARMDHELDEPEDGRAPTLPELHPWPPRR